MTKDQIKAEERMRQEVREELQREAQHKAFPAQFIVFVLVLLACAWVVSGVRDSQHRAQADRASDSLLRDIGAAR